ncbi:hypothetical protein GALMADRAFT_420002 [Galerina marginata CBS 339.88]|uniref:F-box domain-containing protein n=1 Tax=Galerina marginata (strain CBS 339.88) TaxID=685588 RepID=A0A067T3R9_GALM3|nr:hypothetical protein GALMADRAFT_420002 [Galerina marginata CBS 339.88]
MNSTNIFDLTFHKAGRGKSELSIFEPEVAPPISMLHDDLLWLIFMVNTEIRPANDAQYDRLQIARRTSQVSRRWREVILQSSSLWGRLIDLNALEGPRRENWRNEVYTRTGNSLLWICGRLSHSGFFFSLMDRDWARVQRLELHQPQFSLSSQGNIDSWKILYRDAPHLQSVSISSRIIPLSPAQPFIPLFADSASLLREFAAVNIKINPRAPWLSNLRSMTLSSPLTIAEMFDTLRMAILLEELVVENIPFHVMIQETSAIPGIPHISLPRLNRLHLSGPINACHSFLGNISPAAGCHLRAEIYQLNTTPDFPSSNEVVNDLSRRILLHWKNLCSVHRPTYLKVISNHHELYLSDSFTKHDSPFYISIVRLLGLRISLLTELSTSSCMSFIQTLHLNIGDISLDLVRPWISLLPSLCSVTELEVNDRTLQFILQYFPDSSLLFPVLHTVRVSQMLMLEGHSQYPFGPYFPFLRTRKAAGSPILVFDLTQTCCPYDMDFLEELTGLLVRWVDKGTVQEYKCGSGQSGVLQFEWAQYRSSE